MGYTRSMGGDEASQVRRHRAGKQNPNHARIDLSISNQATGDTRKVRSYEPGGMAGTITLVEFPVSLVVSLVISIASDVITSVSMIEDQAGCRFVCLWPWQLENLDLDGDLALIGECTSVSASSHTITDLPVR